MPDPQPMSAEETAYDRGYCEGRRRSLINQLSQALGQLGVLKKPEDDPLIQLALLVTERQEALQVLRRACQDFGDNDWKEDLHVSDIIESHLVRHLERERARKEV